MTPLPDAWAETWVFGPSVCNVCEVVLNLNAGIYIQLCSRRDAEPTPTTGTVDLTLSKQRVGPSCAPSRPPSSPFLAPARPGALWELAQPLGWFSRLEQQSMAEANGASKYAGYATEVQDEEEEEDDYGRGRRWAACRLWGLWATHC